MPFDFPELIGSLSPRAFFTNSSVRDDNFPVEGVCRCVSAAEPIYALFGAGGRLKAVYPDAPHEFPDEVRQRASRFLDAMLR